eukprot:EC849932.1.p3 GENE.EC849932.1~~EC849932.1.p3  ORF type:complete len:80 (+),score=23.39 EC849932.1:133-372(+)
MTGNLSGAIVGSALTESKGFEWAMSFNGSLMIGAAVLLLAYGLLHPLVIPPSTYAGLEEKHEGLDLQNSGDADAELMSN